MAVEFDKELVPSATRTNIYMIDPREIGLDPQLNGRVRLPDITQRVADFKDPTVGQLQPITIRKKDGRPVIIDGITRWRAALQVTEEKAGPFEGGVFKLACSYRTGSDIECFIATIKANIRDEPTPEDDAHNISILIHNFHMDEADVAGRVYGRYSMDATPDIKWVRERLAIADLSKEALEALKAGKLTAKSAVTLAKLSKAAQNERVRAAGAGKITGAIIKGETESNGNGHVKARKFSEFRLLWTPYAEKKDKSKLSRFAEAQLAYAAGGDPDEYFRTVSELLG